ncbi:hypothetical protein AX17_003136 [Amanita inopinata Kibby_2008]|nr:hypothetical protein AX17_003136 [Amanita inopinata Kibby_2008]
MSRSRQQLLIKAQVFPTNQLPREILAEIFKHCLPDAEDIRTNLKDMAPLLLCSICKSWRSLAQAMPELWSTMMFCVRTTNMDQGKVDAFIDAWMERSGDLPLMILLTFLPNLIWVTGSDFVHGLLKTLSRYSSRWEHIDFDLTFAPSMPLPPLGEMPLLRSIRCTGTGSDLCHPFISNPRLTRLHWPCSKFILSNPSIRWSQITHLSFETGMTSYTVIKTIETCPELVELVAIADEDLGRDRRLPRKPRVKHRKLRKLDVLLQQNCGFLLDSLLLPALTDLTLDNDSDHAYEGKSFIFHPVWKHFSRFLTHSQCKLEKLTLNNSGCNTSVFLKCLQHESLLGLTYLKLANVYNEPLFTDEVLARLTDTPCDTRESLLPNLSHLTLEMCVVASPGMLGGMILSRCDSWVEEDQLNSFTFIGRSIDAQDNSFLDKACNLGMDIDSDIDSDYYSW